MSGTIRLVEEGSRVEGSREISQLLDNVRAKLEILREGSGAGCSVCNDAIEDVLRRVSRILVDFNREGEVLEASNGVFQEVASLFPDAIVSLPEHGTVMSIDSGKASLFDNYDFENVPVDSGQVLGCSEWRHVVLDFGGNRPKKNVIVYFTGDEQVGWRFFVCRLRSGKDKESQRRADVARFKEGWLDQFAQADDGCIFDIDYDMLAIFREGFEYYRSGGRLRHDESFNRSLRLRLPDGVLVSVSLEITGEGMNRENVMLVGPVGRPDES